MIINVENFESSILEKVNDSIILYKNDVINYIALKEILKSIRDTISYFQDLMLDNFVINNLEYDVEFNNYLFDIRSYINDVISWSVDYITYSNTPVPVYKKQEYKEEEQKQDFITLVKDQDLSSDKIIQGYAFLTSTGECLCEYIYFKEENKLEIYDLEELNTKYFINSSINEIKSIIEGIFYWGVV